LNPCYRRERAASWNPWRTASRSSVEGFRTGDGCRVAAQERRCCAFVVIAELLQEVVSLVVEAILVPRSSVTVDQGFDVHRIVTRYCEMPFFPCDELQDQERRRGGHGRDSATGKNHLQCVRARLIESGDHHPRIRFRPDDHTIVLHLTERQEIDLPFVDGEPVHGFWSAARTFVEETLLEATERRPTMPRPRQCPGLRSRE
jgi:hypothetical protein